MARVGYGRGAIGRPRPGWLRRAVVMVTRRGLGRGITMKATMLTDQGLG